MSVQNLKRQNAAKSLDAISWMLSIQLVTYRNWKKRRNASAKFVIAVIAIVFVAEIARLHGSSLRDTARNMAPLD